MKKQEIERRYVNDVIEVKDNVITGRCITFNSESQDMGFIEIVKPEAVSRELIDKSDVYALMNHDRSKVLARSRKGKGSLSLEIRDDGVYYEFSLPNTELGNELAEHIKRGEIFGSSFAFTVPADGSGEIIKRNSDNKVVRTITKISGLFDVSPCYEPAYLDSYCSQRMLDIMNDEKLNQLQETIEPIQEEVSEETRENVEEILEEKSEEDSVELELREEKSEDEKSEEKVEEVEDEKSEDEKLEEKTDEKSDEKSEDEKNTKNEENRNIEEINNKKDKIHMNNTKTNFSLLRAIKDIAENRKLDVVNESIIDLGKKEMRDAGISYAGQIQIPYEVRDTVTVNAEGEDVVMQEIWDILEPLRAKNVLASLGADIHSGLINNVKIPLLSKSNVSWESEVSPAKDGAGSFSHVELSPKRLSAYIDISKQFLIQTENLQAEAKLRNDLIKAIQAKLEETIFSDEQGSATQPQGMFYGVTPETISDFQGLCDLEASIELENISGPCKYVMNPKSKAFLRNMSRGTDHTRLVMEGNEVDGTPALVTTNIDDNLLIYGDWSNLIIGQWGGLDITVDPYTQAVNGCVRLVVNAYFDMKVARTEAFAFGEIDNA